MVRNAALALVTLLLLSAQSPAQKPFTIEQILSAPFPANLIASKSGSRLAWTLDQ